METGRTVILLNLENLYESLYDALNQVSFVSSPLVNTVGYIYAWWMHGLFNNVIVELIVNERTNEQKADFNLSSARTEAEISIQL